MLSAVTSILVGLAAAILQTVPDFTGRWVLQSPSVTPEMARVLVVEQPLTTSNVNGTPMLPAFLQISIRREGEAGGTTEIHRIGVLGGSVGGLVAGESRAARTHQATIWEGATLVFRGGSYTGESPRSGEWTERREAWSLSTDGTLTIEISIEGSARPRQTQRWVYARQQ